MCIYVYHDTLHYTTLGRQEYVTNYTYLTICVHGVDMCTSARITINRWCFGRMWRLNWIRIRKLPYPAKMSETIDLYGVS